MQIDTSPASEKNVIKEIDLLKRYKAAGQNGLVLSFIKDNNQMFT